MGNRIGAHIFVLDHIDPRKVRPFRAIVIRRQRLSRHCRFSKFERASPSAAIKRRVKYGSCRLNIITDFLSLLVLYPAPGSLFPGFRQVRDGSLL